MTALPLADRTAPAPLVAIPSQTRTGTGPELARSPPLVPRRAELWAQLEGQGASVQVGVFTQSVGVERDGHGMPRYLHWNGRRYVVTAEPVRWYERRNWWVEERRAERGRGAGLIDHEIWRLQVRLAQARTGPLLTLDIAHHRDSGRWRLIRTHDGTTTRIQHSA